VVGRILAASKSRVVPAPFAEKGIDDDHDVDDVRSSATIGIRIEDSLYHLIYVLR